MIDLLIDAPLLACPNGNDADADFNSKFLEFATNLAELSRFRRSFSGARMWRESSLASTLYTIDAYPFRHALALAMPRLDPDLGLQLEDISRLALALLSKSGCLNDFVEIEDLVVENCTISNDPVSSRGPELMAYSCKLTELAFCHLGGSISLPSFVRFASHPPAEISELPILTYEVAMMSFQDDSIDCSKIERKFELNCFCDSETTFRSLDPAAIWMREDEVSMLDAIAIFSANQGDISHSELSAFKKNIRTYAKQIID